MDVFNALKAFFVGSSPFVAVLTTFAMVYLWTRVTKLQDQLIASADVHAKDLKAVTADFAKQLDAVQAEHVETAISSLRVTGAMTPLLEDIRNELLRRGRVLSGPKPPVLPEVKP